MHWLPISNFIDIKGLNFCYGSLHLICVHVFSHRQFYITFPAGLNAGDLDNSKIGSVWVT